MSHLPRSDPATRISTQPPVPGAPIATGSVFIRRMSAQDVAIAALAGALEAVGRDGDDSGAAVDLYLRIFDHAVQLIREEGRHE